MIDNKSIVLTGASSGIGFEVLKLLARGKGNRILAVARHVDNIKYFADNVTAFACDISTKEGVDRVFAKAEELFGKIVGTGTNVIEDAQTATGGNELTGGNEVTGTTTTELGTSTKEDV